MGSSGAGLPGFLVMVLLRILFFSAGMAAAAKAAETLPPLADPAPSRLTLDQAYDRALATDQSIALALQTVVQADLQPARALGAARARV